MVDDIRRGSRRNFFIIDNALFDEKVTLGPLEKLVYVCLMRYADNSTREAFPGQQKIANDCGITRQRVNNAISVLIENGYIEKKQRFDKTGAQKSNLYIVYDVQEVINRVSYQITGGVNQDDRGCQPGLQEGVNQDDTKKTHLKILSEEEKLFAKEKIKSLKNIALNLKSLGPG